MTTISNGQLSFTENIDSGSSISLFWIYKRFPNPEKIVIYEEVYI